MIRPALHGFSLIRNGLKYDYPFRESFAGLRELCDSALLAVGKSEDNTVEALSSMDIEQLPTVWDETKRLGGLVLSEQTNIALSKLRQKRSGWGFYLQADEAISERDFDRIREDVARADAEGYDCISFRYLHFWQSYERICVGRRWYPQEIRAINLAVPIESYGDAQSFRGWKKRYESEAVIYHYGHVREAAAYEKKKRDFHRWWHPDKEIASVIAKGEKSDLNEETIAYLGPHPASMRLRIEAHGGLSSLPKRKLKVFGEPSVLGTRKVQAELEWLRDERLLLKQNPSDTVLLRKLSPIGALKSMGRFRSQVPEAMGSKNARPWTAEFQALLRFSERGVRVE